MGLFPALPYTGERAAIAKINRSPIVLHSAGRGSNGLAAPAPRHCGRQIRGEMIGGGEHSERSMGRP